MATKYQNLPNIFPIKITQNQKHHPFCPFYVAIVHFATPHCPFCGLLPFYV
jgi:hypothetical protein